MTNRSNNIHLNSKVVLSTQQVSAELANEEVILNLKNNVYYGLNEVGAEIWKYIKQSKSVSEIIDHILDQYEVERQQCEQDILAILNDLWEAELIEVTNEKAE